MCEGVKKSEKSGVVQSKITCACEKRRAREKKEAVTVNFEKNAGK